MFWSVIACGPGHGVMTEDNSIVIPLWFAQNKTDMFSHHPSVVTVLRMENGGNSFFLSKPVGENILCDPNESCIALMPGGELLLNIRNENDNRRRSLAKSYDGGKTWTSPKFCVDLPDPICFFDLTLSEKPVNLYKYLRHKVICTTYCAVCTH